MHAVERHFELIPVDTAPRVLAMSVRVDGVVPVALTAVSYTHLKHYIVRTSWVVGDGKNFLKTMASLADQGTSPSVVSDQVGRLTFTSDLARGIIHLLTSEAPFGTYNLSGEGPVMSWAQVAKRAFELCGRDPADVNEVTPQEYFAGREVAPRPLSSVLDLTKIKATGFTPEDSSQRIDSYVASLRG